MHLPRSKAGWRKMACWNGIVVVGPTTIYSARARRIRAIASARSSPQTISLPSSES